MIRAVIFTEPKWSQLAAVPSVFHCCRSNISLGDTSFMRCFLSILSLCVLVSARKGQVGARPVVSSSFRELGCGYLSGSAGSMRHGRWPWLSCGIKAFLTPAPWDSAPAFIWYTAGRQAAGAEMQLEAVGSWIKNPNSIEQTRTQKTLTLK